MPIHQPIDSTSDTLRPRPASCVVFGLLKLPSLVAATFICLPALGAPDTPTPAAQPQPASEGSVKVRGAAPLPTARRIAEQIVASADNGRRPFLIVDKIDARVHVFAPDGTLWASSPVLLGAARGDDSVPGIGERKIADIRPFERTTPAGRFKAEAGRNLGGEDIVWIDYEAAVSMHRVRATNPSERRLERLASSTVADNRISYGCINVPAAFYDAWVSPIFKIGRAPVYVLPEVRHEHEVFSFLRAGAPAPAPVSPTAQTLSAARPGN